MSQEHKKQLRKAAKARRRAKRNEKLANELAKAVGRVLVDNATMAQALKDIYDQIEAQKEKENEQGE
jgi:transcriptional regulator NrdR family protein